MSRRTGKPFECPVCGEDVPANAKACPECGACEKSGWSEDLASSGLDLPDEDFDYEKFVARLKQDYPDEQFLILRFGDHQPAISQKLLEPGIDRATLGKRLMASDPRYFSTYYAIDTVNFRPVNLSSALDTLDAAYLPIDPSFAEQKKIMLRCNGEFYACSKGAEARRFNRLLIEAGLINGL